MVRDRLPGRRRSLTIPLCFIAKPNQDGEVQSWFDLTIGVDDEGFIKEVFIRADVLRNEFNVALAHDIAVGLSIALQHGASVDELRHAVGREWVNRMGKLVNYPSSLLGAVLDAMAAEIGLPPIEPPKDPLIDSPQNVVADK